MKYYCKIEEIDLCSINARYCKNHILSKKYRECLENLTIIFSSFKYQDFETIKGDIHINIEINQYADIDNYLKVIFDALQKAEIIENDRDIIELKITKYREKRGKFNKLELSIFWELYIIALNAECKHKHYTKYFLELQNEKKALNIAYKFRYVLIVTMMRMAEEIKVN